MGHFSEIAISTTWLLSWDESWGRQHGMRTTVLWTNGRVSQEVYRDIVVQTL